LAAFAECFHTSLTTAGAFAAFAAFSYSRSRLPQACHRKKDLCLLPASSLSIPTTTARNPHKSNILSCFFHALLRSIPTLYFLPRLSFLYTQLWVLPVVIRAPSLTLLTSSDSLIAPHNAISFIRRRHAIASGSVNRAPPENLRPRNRPTDYGQDRGLLPLFCSKRLSRRRSLDRTRTWYSNALGEQR
jgi:hypothetical protein